MSQLGEQVHGRCRGLSGVASPGQDAIALVQTSVKLTRQGFWSTLFCATGNLHPQEDSTQ
jgi:hypothetical protein